jgi:hypothetical protein
MDEKLASILALTGDSGYITIQSILITTPKQDISSSKHGE